MRLSTQRASEIAELLRIEGCPIFYRAETSGVCCIGNVIVAQEARGKGVATFIVETMTALAFDRYDATEVQISCFNENTAGLLLYQSSASCPCCRREVLWIVVHQHYHPYDPQQSGPTIASPESPVNAAAFRYSAPNSLDCRAGGCRESAAIQRQNRLEVADQDDAIQMSVSTGHRYQSLDRRQMCRRRW